MSDTNDTMENTETVPAGDGPVDPPVEPAADTRRYGRFTLPADWVHQLRTEAKRVMSMCIVFRAEHLFHSDVVEYWAASEHFRPLPLGEVVPEYRWTLTDDGGIWCQEVKTSPMSSYNGWCSHCLSL